jgi:hypothetical protein
MAGDDDELDLTTLCLTAPSLRTLLTASEMFTAEFGNRASDHRLATITLRTLRALTRMWFDEALEGTRAHRFEQAIRALERAADLGNAVPVNSLEEPVLARLPSVPEGRRRAPQVRQLREFIAGVMARPAAPDDAENVLEQARVLGLGPPRRRDSSNALTLERDIDDINNIDDGVLVIGEGDQPDINPFDVRLAEALTSRSSRGLARRRAIDKVLLLTLRGVGLTERRANSLLRSTARSTPKRAKRETGKPRRRRK